MIVIVKIPHKGYENLCPFPGLVGGLVEGCLGGMGS